MQRRLRFCITLVLFAAVSKVSFAGEEGEKKDSVKTGVHFQLGSDSEEFVIEDDEDSTDNIVQFNNPWKMKSADDRRYAAEKFDDTHWKELKKEELKKIKKDSGSIAWYRMHFEIDSTLMNVPLAFYIHQFGTASEVYLDGKLLRSFGKVGKDVESETAEFSLINPRPHAIVFSSKKNHVFALRVSDFHRSNPAENRLNIPVNFYISIKHLNNEIADISDTSSYFPFIFFAAIFLTLGFFHLILYIFNRQKRSNLVYSIYCFGVFGFSYGVYHILTATEFTTVTITLLLLAYAVPFIFVTLVGMLHRIFYGRRLKIFWIFPVLLIIAIQCLVSGNFKEGTLTVIILFMLAIIEIIRVIIQAIRRKKDGAWIFAMVILLAPMAGIVSSNLPDTFTIAGLKIPNNTPAIVGSCFILGLPFAMTLYLARDFSRMTKQLTNQLKEITGLSEKTIQQEKEKKIILENQKTELEIKVVERTKEVIEQKEVIEIKNKEITDSLNYAKRIQSAILPDVKLIYKTLEQAFILYLPKDIVSGDFYAFAQKENKVLIAAADCTGHGVAGAFMSMIGSSLLNSIINEKNITEPATILDHLNEGIIDALKQKENESSDGMDISICTFDFNKNELQFGGANRPLWLVRNNELHFYKPNKFPIGGLQVVSDEKFTQHVIQLQKNDTIYIFSDGYADQFGGDKGKKLMTRRFRETLLSIQNKTMHEQEIYLKEYFEKWKGANEQVDDVLVIGVRV